MSHCSAGDRCVYFDRQTKLPAELTDHLPICEGCLSASERAVSALPFDYVSLEQQLPPSLGVWGDGQPASRDQHPVPLNLAAADLQREIWWVTTTWEEIVRERDKLSDPVTKGVREARAVDDAVKILRPRIRLLAAIQPVELVYYPALDDDEPQRFRTIEHQEFPGWRGVLDFVRLHWRAHTLLGLNRSGPVQCKGVPCKSCDMAGIWRLPIREEGDPIIYRCGVCDLVYDEEEYFRWVGMVAEYARGREVA